jgi:uncharacterized membrane protein
LKKLIPYSVDAVAVAGCLAVIYGVAQIHRPSAWILSGLMAIAAAVFVSWSTRRA